MNANEIAEQLENISWLQGDGKVKPFQHYANFVRQQQAELETLKEKAIKQKEKNYEIFKDYNKTINKLTQELTDEEIAELSDKILCYQIYDNKESGVFEFARAILRKARGDV